MSRNQGVSGDEQSTNPSSGVSGDEQPTNPSASTLFAGRKATSKFARHIEEARDAGKEFNVTLPPRPSSR